jgi:hypothetical protein
VNALWDEYDRWLRGNPQPRRRYTDRWPHKGLVLLALVCSHTAVWSVTNWWAEIDRWSQTNGR